MKKMLDAFSQKRIHVIAPASGISSEKLDALRKLNLNLIIPPEILAVKNQTLPYHANTDEKRLEQLKLALLDPSDSIIWILRGGYGCARLLDELRILPVPKHQKIVIGFSDVTALHLFLSQQWGWKTIHGSGISQLLDVAQDPENFLRIAEICEDISNFSRLPEKIFSDLFPMNALAKKQNALSGNFTGGNLTLVETSIGTHWQIQAAGKILFLEECGEKGYRIDRSLYHLYQAGIFSHVKAIILGQFYLTNETEDETIVMALNRFSEMMEKQGIPVYKTNQFGHQNMNYPWCYS